MKREPIKSHFDCPYVEEHNYCFINEDVRALESRLTDTEVLLEEAVELIDMIEGQLTNSVSYSHLWKACADFLIKELENV